MLDHEPTSTEKHSTYAILFRFCELQTLKAEHGSKIKTDRFFGQQIDTLVGQVMIFLLVMKICKIIFQTL